ncbi:HAAS domain-containing protein [Pseudalkalibacillus berkeleyi]|uniref:HAAS transmembrane region domain-containing protein n=1 Tax=Pseudalkalibacillus berkeleyi TaxID=1069813 RepID=A0ABS9GYN9_9BACL|nr:hypothetical protein [Pseudalkalibacillus berkeleyi]MCF6136613.1 hypothetical protein [Pseudalkalibacillus berkeleyi]
MGLSKKSQDFLENLRLYLVTGGKKEHEIEEIISELEDHLTEAEMAGKDVEDIVEKSPKEYMQQLSNEISLDVPTVAKYGLLILLGAFSYIVFGDVLRGGIEYSFIQIIGYPLVILLNLGLVVATFRYIASSGAKKTKQWILFGMLGSVPILLFLAVLFLDQYINTTTIKFGTAGNIAAGILSLGVFIGMAIWSRTWVMILFPIFMFGPELVLKYSNFGEEAKLIGSSFIMFVLIGVYLLFVWRKELRKNKAETS